MTTIESRVFRRADYKCAVRCASADGASFDGETQNISDGGVLLRAGRSVELGARLSLALPLGEGGAPVTIGSVVRWVREDGAGWAIGAEFDDDEPGLEAVRALVEGLAPTAWAEGESSAIPRRIAVEFVPVVRRMARSMSRMVPVHVDDLIASGFLGLVEAYRTFRPDLNPSFDAYARLRIRGTMMDEARSIDTMSRRQRAVGKVIAKARNEFIARNGCEPTPEQLAQVASMSIDAVEAHRLAAVSSKPALEDDAVELHDRHATPEASAARREGIAQVQVALSGLPPRLRDILEMYYGQEMTLRSIAMVVGVSEARVSQLHSEAIRKLRERCDVG